MTFVALCSVFYGSTSGQSALRTGTATRASGCGASCGSWRITPVRHTPVAVKGLWLYLNALRGKWTELESVVMVRELHAGLVGTVRELGAGRLWDGYERSCRRRSSGSAVRSTPMRCGCR